MSERDVFEERLEAAVREFVEAAPKEIDAARLTHSLATDVPRVRRLVPRPTWRLPSLGFSWIPIAAVLVAALGLGLVATGGLRGVLPGPVQPTPTLPLETPPAVIASPVATTPSPSAALSPSGNPQQVVITSLMVVSATGPNTGTFDARGDASASGLICQHGTVTDLVAIDSGAFASGELLDFTVPKEFGCDDDSGTFVVELLVHIDPVAKTESFTWRVLRGTGVYTHLQGAGNGTTMGPASGQALNTLTGSLVN